VYNENIENKSREEDDSLEKYGLDNTVVRRGILAPLLVCNLRRTIVVVVDIDFSFLLTRSNETKQMGGAKRKRKYHRTFTNKINNSKRRSSRVITKNLEIFVTDFLTDPCELPVELRDCILVDGTTSLNDTTGFIRIITSINV
jgi:hypothetical protein